MNLRVVLAAAFLCAGASPALAQAPLLNVLFEDHAVLQRDRPIPVWGHAEPGASVTVALGSASVTTQADPAGRWRAMLPAMAAGGPYTLTARSGSDEETANDVLVGDVYLCAGQSNMVLEVHRTLNARAEVADADNDTIRMLTVPDATSLAPQDAFAKPAAWEKTTPETVGDFSAACYYFARELQKSARVPLGLINAAWGGANIRTFMSEDAVRKAGGRDNDLAILDLYRSDPATATQRWGRIWMDWWNSKMPSPHGQEPWAGTLDTNGWSVAPVGLGHWDEWPQLAGFTGLLWYRTNVTLTADQATQDAVLSLGAINEEDETWVNGKVVGNMFGYGSERTYKLPAGVLHAGENSIALAVLCTYRGCGLFGPAEKRAVKFADGSSVPLVNPWLYKTVPQNVGVIPRAPWGAVAGLGMAYNAMIAPLGDYGLRGVVWYQGESNEREPETYKTLLSGLLADWRAQFGAPDLPFLIVQLPDYGKPPTAPEDSSWARLRDAQRAVAANDPHAALVVTIDIGEHSDIHPANKQELGRRLARAARHLIYGEDIVPTGPTATAAVRVKNQVVVRFADVENALVAYSAANPIGFELCDAIEESCRFATAHVAQDRVAIDIPAKLAPAAVRYCWANGPICTLFDGAGLPAGPFSLAINGTKPQAVARAGRARRAAKRSPAHLHTAKAK
jgi:sialate O-acetylesterase